MQAFSTETSSKDVSLQNQKKDLPIVNISGYLFVDLKENQLHELREKYLQFGQERVGLKGLILLSTEGINVAVSGLADELNQLIDFFKADSFFKDLEFKYSYSAKRPFKRYLVKIREQLIPVGDRVNPLKETAAYISPQKLKHWLDEGEDIILLDTRNVSEFRVGSFEKASHLGIRHFRQFADQAKENLEQWQNKKVVTFCTGGIRCEKAAPLLKRYGLEEVYQLDGGILKYLEEFGSDHYRGDCFVFDTRFAVDSLLQPTGAVQCPRCENLVYPNEQKENKYQFGETCPHCADPVYPEDSIE